MEWAQGPDTNHNICCYSPPAMQSILQLLVSTWSLRWACRDYLLYVRARTQSVMPLFPSCAVTPVVQLCLAVTKNAASNGLLRASTVDLDIVLPGVYEYGCTRARMCWYTNGYQTLQCSYVGRCTGEVPRGECTLRFSPQFRDLYKPTRH